MTMVTDSIGSGSDGPAEIRVSVVRFPPGPHCQLHDAHQFSGHQGSESADQRTSGYRVDARGFAAWSTGAGGYLTN